MVGLAPASKSGSAASLSETVQELGIAIGVALLGSLTTAVYRSQLTIPDGLSDDEAAALTDSLSATVSIADQLPAGVLLQAQQAFTTGLNVASVIAGCAITVVTVLCLRMLRHLPRLDQTHQPDHIS